MASTTGSSRQNAGNTRYRGSLPAAYTLPGSPDKPECLISSRHGPAMQAGPVEDLCTQLLNLELLMICGLNYMYDKYPSSPAAPQWGEGRARQMVEIEKQMEDVFLGDRGDCRFHEKYPEDRYLGQYWWDCMKMLFDFKKLNNPTLVQWAHDSLKRIEDQSVNVQAQLIESAGLVKLSPEIRGATQHKWIKLEEGLAMHDREFSTSTRCQTWYVATCRYPFTDRH